MFHALRAGTVRAAGLEFRDVLADIQTLNRWATRGRLEVTALSFYGWAHVARRYRLLPHGASVGDGYGPLVVARRSGLPADLAGCRVAVPGRRTTSFLVFRLRFPRAKPVVVPFDRIVDAVRRGRVDAGVLIHEGQLTWRRLGLRRIEDLGAWWKNETGTPLVLGINAVRRGLSPPLIRRVSRALFASIRFGLGHRREALSYAMRYGRGIHRRTADRFVAMYVNRDTLAFRPATKRGMRLLLARAVRAGLLRRVVPLDFAPAG